MRRSLLVPLLSALVAAFTGISCASGAGGPTASTDLTSQDLAGLQYESLYQFLEEHSEVRLETGQGSNALLVRVRRSDEMGMGQERQASLSGDTTGGFPGGDESNQPETPEVTAIGQGQYVAAKLYVDGSEENNPTTRLREISLQDIQRLRILRPTEASSYFGGSGEYAAVAVTLKESS